LPARLREADLPAGVRSLGIVVAFVALVIALSAASPIFLTTRNLSNVLDSWAPTLIVAAGVTVVLLAGGFDLSVAAVFSLAGILAAKTGDPVVGMIVGLAAGAAVGLLNGLLVSVVRIHSFLATLATALAVGGISLLLTHGKAISVLDPSFGSIGLQKLGDFTVPTFVALGVVVGVGLVLAWTTFGDQVYAVGGNQDAARVAGVRTGRIKALTFVLSGCAAALAGVLVAFRDSSGDLQSGEGLEFLALTAVVIGGNSIFGGEGAIWRTVVGVLFLAVIGNGFNLLEFNSVYQNVVYGGIILLAVAIDAWTRRTA
jgi:ribose transport system permease protein